MFILAWLALAHGCYATTLSNGTGQADNGAYAREFPSALLMQNDAQTFCPIVILTDSAGVAPASCIDAQQSTIHGGPTELTVAVGLADDAVSTHRVTGFKVHDKYDPSSFANNLAVVTFDMLSAQATYTVAGKADLYSEYTLAARSLDADNKAWRSLQAATAEQLSSDVCSKASALYKENSNAFLCSSQLVGSPFSSQCRLPYGYVAAISDQRGAAQFAIYSHSASTSAQALCDSSSNVVSYYTVLANYLGWIQDAIGPASTLSLAKDSQVPDAPFSMAIPKESTQDSWSVFSMHGNGQGKSGPDRHLELRQNVITRFEKETMDATVFVTTPFPSTVYTTTIKVVTETDTYTDTTTIYESHTQTTQLTLVRQTTSDLTTTSIMTMTDMTVDECPAQDPCIMATEISDLVVTETVTETETSTNNPMATMPPQRNTDTLNVSVLTVTIGGETETTTMTVFNDESGEPMVVTETIVTTAEDSLGGLDQSSDKSSPSESESSSESTESTEEESPTEDDVDDEDSSSSDEYIEEEGSSTGKIAGIIAGVVIAILLLGLLLYCIFRKKRKDRAAQMQTMATTGIRF